MALVIDAMELLYTQDFDGFCIASSYADFTPFVMQLRFNSRDVYGFGERKTPDPFVNACTTFLYLDSLDATAGEPEATTQPACAKPKVVAEPAPKSCAVSAPKPKPTPGRNLAGDTKLVTAPRGGVAASAGEDGWALLSAAGGAAQRQASIDPRNYGVKGFRALFEGTKLFDIFKAGGEHYVADKRNKSRAAQPAL